MVGCRRAPGTLRAVKALNLLLVFLVFSVAVAQRPSVTVRSGDTLYAIARQFGTSVRNLRNANPGLGEFIRPGERLLLPLDASYGVRAGENLAGIAARFGTTVEALVAANNLTGRVVNPGARLRLAPDHDESERTYTVRSGDTLYDIAVAVDVPVETLIALNRLDGTVIRPGQQLVVSGASDAPPSASTPLVIAIQPGDTLWGIARTHDLTVADLRRANGFDAAKLLRPGERLTIPGHYPPDTHDLGAAMLREVTVRAGDTLSGIARRHDTSVAALMSANGLEDDRIRRGQRLRIIPGDELNPAGVTAPAAGVVGNLRWPVPGAVTSRFGYRTLRVNGSNFHNAIDIDGVTGEPVRAASAGTVSFSGWRGSYGNLVVVRSGNIEYRYAHNSELLVRPGTRVDAGDVLARVGDTGLSFGDHVHFEVRVDGTPVDPLPLLNGN